MKRKTLYEAGLRFAKRIDSEQIVLRDIETGKLELWFINDGHASYGVSYLGHDYEFARTLGAEE